MMIPTSEEDSSCIFYQNIERTIFLLDIPRSLELAQELSGPSGKKKLLSCKAPDVPFSSLEPKHRTSSASTEDPSIPDLLLQRHLSFVLEEVRESSPPLWLLPRIIDTQDVSKVSRRRKRPVSETSDEPCESIESNSLSGAAASDHEIFQNAEEHSVSLTTSQFGNVFVPPKSSFLLGDIEETSKIFQDHAPLFDFVIMDPPWPNRSARRKKSYSTAYGLYEMTVLFSRMSLECCLASNALVGIWVTNKPAFRELITGSDGLFEKWGLKLEEEWIWLKITSSGQPICRLESTYRRPYEILLLGRKTDHDGPLEVKRRVIIGAPDLHSRKPNLRSIVEPMLPLSYNALEIFARNLTAGWWAWGNEVLRFQAEENWIEKNGEPE